MDENLNIEALIARLLSHNTKCTNPKCGYENINSNNYCVKCGWLLPGHSKKVVINSNEYEELKKKANMSAWEKLKENFSK